MTRYNREVTREKTCEICNELFAEGDSFDISALTDPHTFLKVCDRCSRAEFVEIDHDTCRLQIRRDDLIAADRDRLAIALGNAHSALEDLGWKLQAITIESRHEITTKPYDD